MKKNVSIRVIRRISLYYEALLKLDKPQDSYISSQVLEEITGISCNQIRQDFFYLGISIGKQKRGYNIKKLFDELQKILTADKGADVIVVGAGRLGCALSEYRFFRIRNINVVGLFDVKEELLDKPAVDSECKCNIYHVDRLEEFLESHPSVTIAILAVPEDAAQDMLDILIRCGIKGVVNFTPRILRLPADSDVILQNECLGASIYKIAYHLNQQDEDPE